MQQDWSWRRPGSDRESTATDVPPDERAEEERLRDEEEAKAAGTGEVPSGHNITGQHDVEGQTVPDGQHDDTSGQRDVTEGQHDNLTEQRDVDEGQHDNFTEQRSVDEDQHDNLTDQRDVEEGHDNLADGQPDVRDEQRDIADDQHDVVDQQQAVADRQHDAADEHEDIRVAGESALDPTPTRDESAEPASETRPDVLYDDTETRDESLGSEVREDSPELVEEEEVATAFPAPTGRHAQPDELEQFMDPVAAENLRLRWHDVQASFVDDPRDAVQQADGLATEVLEALSQTLTERKRVLDNEWRTGDDDPDTEKLRLALRGYRDFFHRMLSI